MQAGINQSWQVQVFSANVGDLHTCLEGQLFAGASNHLGTLWLRKEKGSEAIQEEDTETRKL